jgi:hypothetical protein
MEAAVDEAEDDWLIEEILDLLNDALGDRVALTA